MKATRAGKVLFGLIVVLQLFTAVGLITHARSLKREAERDAERLPRIDGVGAVMAVGGGGTPTSVCQAFLDLAGGDQARIVVVPTAWESSDREENLEHSGDFLRNAGATNVVVLHARSRDQANDPVFLQPLATATAVWFSGGYQRRLAERYLGTAFETRVKQVVQRGGVVGGTSAGASFLARPMILGGIARAEMGEGLGLISDVVIDQHFLKRNRFSRLMGVLAEHPQFLGLGIDEATAVVFRGERLDIVGQSFVIACAPMSYGDGMPRLVALKHGDGLNLAMLRKPDRRERPWLQPAGDDR